MSSIESASRSFQPGEGPSRGLLRDCTTGCGTDGSICGTSAGFKFGWISTEAGIGQSWTNFCAWIFARPSIYLLIMEFS